MRTVIKSTIQELRNWPNQSGWINTQQAKAREGTLNLIIGDGKRIFGVRDGAENNPSRQIFIGSHADSQGNQDVLFATDQLQPLNGSNKIHWSKVPYHTVFSIKIPKPIKAKVYPMSQTKKLNV